MRQLVSPRIPASSVRAGKEFDSGTGEEGFDSLMDGLRLLGVLAARGMDETGFVD